MWRREILLKGLQGLGVLAFSALPFGMARLLLPRQIHAGQQWIPLPGAQTPQTAFVAACIGCGLCGEVCPPRCIKFNNETNGSEAHTPYIDPAERGCILCAKCIEVCPTDALVATPIAEVKMGIAQIDRAACYPWVDQGVCGACVSICPLGERAISFEMWNQYRPIVQQGCVGCGLCVEICPEPSLPIRIVMRDEPTVAQHGLGIRRRSYQR